MPCIFKKPILGAIALLCCAMIAQPVMAASATSDALFILDADGKSVTVQHSIASDGPLVALDIPVDAQVRQIRFLGPNQARHQENAFEQNNPVQLWDGVALVRYHHLYGEELTQTGPNAFELSISSLPRNFAVEDGNITRSSYTWVFPDNIELTNYSAISEDMGRWQLSGKELAYEQSEQFAVTLTIGYKVLNNENIAPVVNSAIANDAFCFPTPDNPDLCAKDSDGDSVPDYRDVCGIPQIQEPSIGGLTNEQDNIEEIAANATSNATAKTTLNTVTENTELNEHSEPLWQHFFGCDDDQGLILKEVQFPSGYSYLDTQSREALDRLAEALQRTDLHFEIGAHTDNAGHVNTNLALAKKRSETVRYYLLLRGVNPNQIRAKGYGEEFPILDNATSDGRRGNRRIEITLDQ